MEPKRQYTGIVTNWKGTYGFIHCDDLPSDVFVHYSEIIEEGGSHGYKRLQKGALVSFEAIRGDRGLEAVKVRNYSQ